MFVYIFCSAALVLHCTATPYADRHQQKEFSRDYAVDEPYQQRPVTHTFPNRTQCMELCELPCSITNVYMGTQNIEMYNCARLKPPKVTMLGSIKSNSFYMTLLVLGCITVGVIVLLTLCFCCSHCCRPNVSSRGSSKDVLTQEDGEFREYLSDPNDVAPVRKEREFSRRGNYRTVQVV